MPKISHDPGIHCDAFLFATDFSPASHNAGLYASALAQFFKVKLVVAHGFTLLQSALEAETETARPSQQRLELTQSLKQSAASLTTGHDLAETVLLEGDPRTEIPKLAERMKPAIPVLGTHGGGSVDRFMLGSTAEGILQNLLGPAITVGPKVDILKAGALRIRRILYATDCSAEAAHAAPVACALTDIFSAQLDVLHVTPPERADYPKQLHQLQQDFYVAVKALMPCDAENLCRPSTFVGVGTPHREILKHVAERGIDLLILGLRRDAHVGMFNRTSGAFPIIVESQCPVLTVASGKV